MAASALIFLGLIAASGIVNAQNQIADGCIGKVMDIFFLLDSSSSIYINDYMSQHRVVRDIVTKFDVSPEATRVGMLTFSDDLERPVIGLNRYANKDELLSEISMQNLPYRTGVTNTDLAIRYVRQLSDFRQDITKVLVVMTDGGSRSPGATAREAEAARAAGFYLYAVGIGQYLEEREWRSIASDPDSSFIYNISSPRMLEEVKFSLPPRACALPPIILGGSCDISRPSEVYFVSARSASDKAIELIDTFKRRTREVRDNLRVNYMIEACGSVSNAALDDEDVNCDRFGPKTGDTAESVSALLSRVREMARQDEEAGNSANRVVVLFTDDSTMSLARFSWANEARAMESFEGFTVVVASLDVRTYRDFDRRLTGNRNNYVYFAPGSVGNQYNAQRQFLDAVCAGSNDSGRNPDFTGGLN